MTPQGNLSWMLVNPHQITLMFEHEKIFFQTENKNSVWITFLHSSQSLISTTFYQKIPISEKPGGRAGLRKFARAMRSMFGSVRAARALQDDSMCLCTRALARKSSW